MKHAKCQPLSQSYYFDRFRERKRERKAPTNIYFLSPFSMKIPPVEKVQENDATKNQKREAKGDQKSQYLDFFLK